MTLTMTGLDFHQELHQISLINLTAWVPKEIK